MTSSQAPACVSWLVRDRTLRMASWRRRPGLCWKSTTSHWRRPEGADPRTTKTGRMGTASAPKEGTTHVYNTNLLSVTFLLYASGLLLVLSWLRFSCMCFIYLHLKTMREVGLLQTWHFIKVGVSVSLTLKLYFLTSGLKRLYKNNQRCKKLLMTWMDGTVEQY